VKHAWIRFSSVALLTLLTPLLPFTPLALAADPAAAGLPVETPSVAVLPAEPGPHWIWVPDRLLQHSVLFDGDSGEVLGMIDSAASLTPKAPVLARGGFYSADIAYSRGLRGERIDFVSIYDAHTLELTGEILLPTRTGQSNASLAYAELLGERFFAIFNQFPNVSVSIVDLEQERFVGEIGIAGCAGIYPVDAQRFATLCGDGTAALVVLAADGSQEDLFSSERFFDPVVDPVFMAAGRDGARWTFVSFEGHAHTLDFSGFRPQLQGSWSLLDDDDRAAAWRPGGLQHVALHGESERLFVAMHRAEPGSHKQAGEEIWVFDVAKQRRVARLDLPNLVVGFLAPLLEVELDSFLARLLGWVLPTGGVDVLTVSQDDDPVLFVRNSQLGAVAVLDAGTGETRRMLTEVGFTGPTMRVP
jgi:methylamine dehydrogenase heavy chain